MPTFDEIVEQIKIIDTNVSFAPFRKDIQELPRILWEDEKIEKIIQGRYGKGHGVMVATNKRVIFISKGFGGRVADFPYDTISDIQYEIGLVFCDITINTSGDYAIIQNIPKNDVKNFAEFLKAKIKGINESKQPSSDSDSDDVFVKIEKLAKLREKGILSEEEFSEQKQKLLSSL
jgi:hypothetical protein